MTMAPKVTVPDPDYRGTNTDGFSQVTLYCNWCYIDQLDGKAIEPGVYEILWPDGVTELALVEVRCDKFESAREGSIKIEKAYAYINHYGCVRPIPLVGLFVRVPADDDSPDEPEETSNKITTPDDVKAMPLDEFEQRYGFRPQDALEKWAFAMSGETLPDHVRAAMADGVLDTPDLSEVVMT